MKLETETVVDLSRLEAFKARVMELVIGAEVVKQDEPENPTGFYFIDFRLLDRRVVVQWNEERGFGVFALDAGCGERPALVDQNIEVAVAEVARLFALPTSVAPEEDAYTA